MTTLDVDLVSDVVCPWCAIGLARFRAAAAMLPDIECRVRWHPFVLNPDLPPEGRDMVTHLAAKYGRTPDEIRESQRRIVAEAEAAGLNFEHAEARRSWNTFDTHRVLHHAREAGCDSAFNEALFEAYFGRAEDPTDPALLRRIGTSLGLDAAAIDAILASDRHAGDVRAEIEHYRQLGVTAVPAFVVGRRYLISGAQPPEVLADSLRRVASSEHASETA